MKFIALLLSLFVVVGLTGAWLGSSESTADTESETLIEVDALPVETLVLQPITSTTRERLFTGTIVAARRTKLAFERSARLAQVMFDDGDEVAEGDVVARIDRRQLQHRLEELQAGRAQQAAILAELQAGPRVETIDATRAEVAALSADVDLKKATLGRTQDLIKRKATSDQALDEVSLAWQASVARRDALTKRLDELLAGTRTEQITAQNAVVAGIDSQLQQLQTDIADSELKAPFAGTIVRRMADEGDFLNPMQPVFELVESGNLEARIGVPSGSVGDVDAAEYVVLKAGDVQFTGTVKRIVPQVDPDTRTQTVVVAIDEARPNGLADGQLVRMAVTESMAVKGFRVPLTALAAASRGLWSIYVVAESTADNNLPGVGILQTRSVEVLHTDADNAIIRGTVYGGERIIATGVHRVVPGQRVRWDTGTPPSEVPLPRDASPAEQE